MNFENLGELNKTTTVKILLFFVRYLSSSPISFKNYLSTIHVNVLLQVTSADALKDIRVNVALPSQQTLNMLEFLKKL